MVTVVYIGSNELIRAAVDCVNHLFTCHPFFESIYKNKRFDMADISPKKIVDMMHDTDIRLTVNLYGPLPFAKDAYAYDDPFNPSVVHINKMTLNRPLHSLCNTITHQAIHAVNAAHSSCYFGHGDNNPAGKNGTAPFWIAGLAQKMVAEDDKVFESMPHEDVQNIPLIKSTTAMAIQENLYKEGVFCFYDLMDIMEA